MKTLRNTLFILVALFVFASCSKKEEEIAPATTLGTELAGDFPVTKYHHNNDPLQDLPADRKITIRFTYVSDTQVQMFFNELHAGQQPKVDDYGVLDLKRVDRTIDLYLDSEKIGSYSNGTVEVGLEASSGTLKFMGKRQ